MTIAIWIAGALLVAIFLTTGTIKLTQPRLEMAAGPMRWAADVHGLARSPAPRWRSRSSRARGSSPRPSTPRDPQHARATGPRSTMVGAIATHARYREHRAASPSPAVLLVDLALRRDRGAGRAVTRRTDRRDGEPCAFPWVRKLNGVHAVALRRQLASGGGLRSPAGDLASALDALGDARAARAGVGRDLDAAGIAGLCERPWRRSCTDSTHARERASPRCGHRVSSSGSTSRSPRRAVTISSRRWSLPEHVLRSLPRAATPARRGASTPTVRRSRSRSVATSTGTRRPTRAAPACGRSRSMWSSPGTTWSRFTRSASRCRRPSRRLPERGGHYVVYSVLDAMLASTFDALDEVELTLDALATRWTDGNDAPVPRATLREAAGRLATMRRWVTAEQAVFARFSVEIGTLRGFDGSEGPPSIASTSTSTACWRRSTPPRTAWGCCSICSSTSARIS